MTTTNGMMPPTLVVAVAKLLDRRNLAHLLPAVLSVLAPHAHQPDTRHDRGTAVTVDIDVVQRLCRLVGDDDRGRTLDVLLNVARPFFAAPPASAPAAVPVVAAGVPLSRREVEVLCGMAAGCSNGEIGAGYYLSEDTVKTHARRLFRKLGVRDRAHAVARAYDLGVLTPGKPLPHPVPANKPYLPGARTAAS